PLGEVFPRMSAAAFGPANCRTDADARLRQHVVELERLAEIGVEHHRMVGDAKTVAHHRDDVVELARALLQQRTGAKYGAMTLHGPLHGQPNLARSGFVL